MRSTFAIPPLLALLSAAPAAHAVQGDQSVRHVAGERAARIESPARQRAWSQQDAWQGFLARRGGQWAVRWDEATGTPARFYGSGWDVDAEALATDEGAFAIAESILAQEAALLGRDVRPSDLARLVVDRTHGVTTVTFQQTWRGVRVDETRLSLRFKAGRFVMGQVETLPLLADVETRPTLAKADAVAAAVSSLGWDQPDQVFDTELVILPVRGERNVTAHLAWRVHLTSQAHRSNRVVWVDAASGGQLGWEEQIRHAGGTISGSMDDRYPENGTADFVLPYAELENEDGTGTASLTGTFSLPGAAPDVVSLQVGSDDFRIDSEGGETTFSGTLLTEGGTVLVAADPTAGAGAQRRQKAQLDAHVSAHIARERAVFIHPNFQWASAQARVNVNVADDACNAWFDPSNNVNNSSVNFLRQGSGCNNMARVWDVMFHEYGHGFHIWSIIFGAGDFDGALSEGLGDYLSGTINDDSGMARGFYQGSTQGLRDIGPNAVWPDDVSESIHTTGLIIAGALWDLRNALVADHGTEGLVHADELYLAVAQRASDIPTSYEEVLLADDDNGNLADGTPNQCLIDEAFGLHGLGPGGDGSAQFGLEFEPLGSSLTPGEGIEIALRAFVVNNACAEGTVGDVRLHWTIDDDEAPSQFDEVGFTSVGGDEWAVTVPALGDGSYLRYWIELVDGDGDVARTLPGGSLTDPWYGAWVGGESLWEDDFEGGDGGFSSALIEGGDQQGANDWMREQPKGGGGDPLGAASGAFAWGNDLQPEQNWNGEYQSDVHNVLRSGPLPAGDGRVHLQFRRWLTVEDGLWDRAWVEVNGTTVWENFAGPNQNDSANHHLDSHWAFRSYDVTDLVSGGEIEVEWHLETDGALTFGGWTIDDVRVLSSEGGGVVGDDDDAAGDDDDAAGDDDDAAGGGGFGGSGSGCACSSGTPVSGSWAWSLLAFAALLGRRRRS